MVEAVAVGEAVVLVAEALEAAVVLVEVLAEAVTLVVAVREAAGKTKDLDVIGHIGPIGPIL